MILVFIFLLLLYILLFLINTDSVEKRVIYKLLKDGDYESIMNHPVPFDVKLHEYFLAPFYFDKHRLTKVSHGDILNLFLCLLCSQILDPLQSLQ